MRLKKFHQFIYLERGPVNTAIIDFLKGNVFQVENNIVEKFQLRRYDEVWEFMESLKKEDLIIKIDEKRWIPRISFETENEKDEFLFELEIEEGVDLNIIKKKFRDFDISRIVYYGEQDPDEILPFVKIEKRKKDFEKCIKLSSIDGEFDVIDESFYGFNKKYNSCWGKKIVVTKDEKLRPCIHSKIIIGDLKKRDICSLVEKIKKFWFITKDNVEKCKDCELRYICFDCREIAKRINKNLLSENPNCNYDPYNGIWNKFKI